MAKKVSSSDKINDTTLHELLSMMDARLKHIEDITADNRAVIIKLVKQSNQVVEFLKNMIIADITDDYLSYSLDSNATPQVNSDKVNSLKELINEVMDKHQELKEFEEELKKHKDKLTPGQIGES